MVRFRLWFGQIQTSPAYGVRAVWPRNPLPSKSVTACVVAIALISATASAPGAQSQERLPGSDLGLNTAIADSDVIETAEFHTLGMVMSSAAQYCGGVRINPLVIHKGAAKHEDSIDHGMVILFHEARPVAGQKYIFFLRGRTIIKMLPRSEENLKAIAAMSKRVEAVMSNDGGLLGSGISLDEAEKRADTVKTVVFDSFSPESVSGSMKSMAKVVVRPSVPFFKGMWADMKSQKPETYGLSSGPAQEVTPGVDEQYIVFIKDRTIFKIVWNTWANRNAVDKLTTGH